MIYPLSLPGKFAEPFLQGGGSWGHLTCQSSNNPRDWIRWNQLGLIQQCFSNLQIHGFICSERCELIILQFLELGNTLNTVPSRCCFIGCLLFNLLPSDPNSHQSSQSGQKGHNIGYLWPRGRTKGERGLVSRKHSLKKWAEDMLLEQEPRCARVHNQRKLCIPRCTRFQEISCNSPREACQLIFYCLDVTKTQQ